MAFTARASTTKVEHDETQLKEFKDLSGVLNALHEDIEKAKADHKEYLSLSSDYEDLKDKIFDIEEEIDTSQEIAKSHLNDIYKLNTEITALKHQKFELEKVCGEFEIRKEKVIQQVKEYEEHVEKLFARSVELTKKIAEKENSHIVLIKRNEIHKDDAEKQIALFDSKITEREGQLTVLDEKHNHLISSIQAKTKELLEAQDNIDTANQFGESIRAKNRAEIEQHIRAMTELSEKHDEREKVLNKREGDASLREVWLAEKENTLKDIKTNLEKFYNRKFDNLKF